MAKKNRSGGYSRISEGYRREPVKSRFVSRLEQKLGARVPGALDSIGGSFRDFSPGSIGNDRFSDLRLPSEVRRSRDTSPARAAGPKSVSRVLPAKTINRFTNPIAPGVIHRPGGAYRKLPDTVRRTGAHITQEPRRAITKAPIRSPLKTRPSLDARKTRLEPATRSLVREPVRRVCKERPDGRKQGSGAKRAFVPWCNRK